MQGGGKTGAAAKPKQAAGAKSAPKAKAKRRGRKKMKLADHVARILENAASAMSPAKITQALQRKGVSDSKYLGTQVMAILRSGKANATKVGRGLYESAGAKPTTDAAPEPTAKKAPAKKVAKPKG